MVINMIYLDNAATTNPKPKNVINAVIKGMNISANPGRSGHEMSLRASEEVFKARKKVADFFSCEKAENVIFTSNCTQSLNTAIRGLLKAGDHVITSSLEHNSVSRVLENLAQEGKITYSVAEVENDDETTVNNFKKLIRPNTKMIVCTHASNVFGTILPIEKIGFLAKNYGLKFVLDTAQSAGKIKIDMEKMNIDALCAPGHKSLYGSMGTGVLLLKSDKIKPFIIGGTGSESMNLNQPSFLPDRLESGTLNLPGIISISAGVDFVNGIGVQKIHEYEMRLCEELYNFLYNSNKYTVYSDPSPLKSVSTVAFNRKGMHSEEVADILASDGICVRAGYHCAYLAHKSRKTDEQGAVRVSLSVFNKADDIKILIKSLNKIEKL